MKKYNIYKTIVNKVINEEYDVKEQDTKEMLQGVINYIKELEEYASDLYTLVYWAEECGFSFDNFTGDHNEFDNKFYDEMENDNSDMTYIEWMAEYVKRSRETGYNDNITHWIAEEDR